MKALLLIATLGFSPLIQAADTPSVLKLSDGRSFSDWKIVSETPSSVFLKYQGGAAKVGKHLLPADVLAAHPIDALGAKNEAAQLARAERIGQERVAALEAQNVRLNEIAASTKAAETRNSPTPAQPSYDGIESAARDRAEEYFKSQRRNGSGYSLVFDLKVSFDETRPIPGWTDRYEVTGKTWYQYYESTWGGSYSNVNSGFVAEVEYHPGDRRPKVVAFRAVYRPAD